MLLNRLLAGAAAGAAGTTALNAATYADMALRGRGASDTPEQTVEAMSDRAGVEIPGNSDTRPNRVSGLGALMGLAAGVGIGAAYGCVIAAVGRPPRWAAAGLVGVGAMVAANGPMAAFGVSDPRTWDAASWLSDAIPHAAYGIVTAFTFDALDRR